jgi:hypothetical protein
MLKTKVIRSVLLSVGLASILTKDYCKPGQSCWPSDKDIQELSNLLDPTFERILSWSGGNNPRISSVPFNSTGDQPLYGLGTKSMKPIYTRSEEDSRNTCF